MIRISIITVTYNSSATLRDTIESVLLQDYDNLEYIVVDGGSRDETVDIIRANESRFGGRMRWISEPDKGLYDAMNKGIMMATGDVVAVLNSDDFYHRGDVISRVAAAFDDANVEAVYGDLVFVSPDNLNKLTRYYSSKAFRPSLFRFGFMPAHPTFFAYKRLFEQFGYYDTSFGIAADFELLVRFMYIRKIRTRYLPFVFMKMRSGGISTTMRNKLKMNREIIRACRKNGISTNCFFIIYKYIVKIFDLLFRKRSGIDL